MKSILAVVAAVAMGVASHVALAQEEQAPEVKVTAIKGTLYLLQGRGNNYSAGVGSVILAQENVRKRMSTRQE